MRVGIGYDVHKLAARRKLVLGGVEIKHPKGLLGHSDADVLTHAVIDALIGAAGKGSIGEFFPDTDPVYKDISSIVLLKKIVAEVRSSGYLIANVDAVVVCQEPKLLPYMNEIRRSLAGTLEIEFDQVNVKAKTEEGLGFTGKKEGIAAHAVCLIHKKV
ncbi:MAG TPA: 2-C-methyl-D-erythritol 2,4-cyclodiphosphate synthase [Candidatus Omnitrophota bacterium]|nr:2-C-methyl-D-erythritol 2,4-cyclodiphosphate synthase [Candidatus Omnitrophota bacterium]